jgi:type II secretory pathway pseudopilin PulG
MIELVIVVVIIGIIAAIAIPRMSRGSAAAADSAVAQNVQVIRSAIDLYQTEHNGVFPAANGSITVPDLLLKYSSLDGTAVSTTKDTTNGIVYGPYLRTVPQITVGARKGSNGIGSADAAGIGWIYDSSTGAVSANASGNDGSGKAYSSY